MEYSVTTRQHMVDLKTHAPASDTNQPKHEKSAGELVFDRTVYTGIGFGVNEVSSLWITDQFMHGKNLLANIPGLKKIGAWFSEEGFSRCSEFLAKTFKLAEKTAKDGSIITPKARAGNSLLMLTLISGGTLLILPMKWLEDSKNYWVKKANHMVDGFRGSNMTPEEVAARDAQVEQDIACAPKQSWPSMLVGRTIAVFSSWATGTFLVGPEKNNQLMNWAEKSLTGSVQPEGARNAAHRYARLLSVETYSCAISSVMLEFMSKLFAKRNSTPHDPELCHPAVKAADPLPANSYEDQNSTSGSPPVGRYSAKIQSQKIQAAAEPVAMHV